MTRAPFLIALPFVVLACTGGEDAAPTNEPVAGETGGATGTEAAPDGPAWTVTLDEADGAPDLPDIEGDNLDASTMGTTLQLSGIDPEHGLTVRITTGQEPATGEYGPSTFSITWVETDHTCVGGTDGVTVSLEGVEPAHGSFSGEVRCYTSTNPTDAFTARMSGTFRDTV